jgi:galactokinase
VNLIGDHTDYTGGLVLPMAIDRYTTVTGQALDGAIRLTSEQMHEPLMLNLPVADAANVMPAWGRYVAGVANQMGCTIGIEGSVTTTIPIGAGLSSSAALEVATALALGSTLSVTELAQLCRRAEHVATGVPCGIMDQLTSAAGVEGHALLIDCHTLDVQPIALPSQMQVVVRFVAARTLVGSEYADRVATCAQAEREIGPLRLATVADTAQIADAVVRARAVHVVSENERVREAAKCLQAGDARGFGLLMNESHESLCNNFAVSTTQMDEAVEEAQAMPGVFGARMTGGGFGGCIVMVADADAPIAASDSVWKVRAVSRAALHPHGEAFAE